MGSSRPGVTEVHYLKDLWDAELAAKFDEPELLRYRSNLLGADLRITNFGGGNTSSKIVATDPISGASTRVLWVKGSGGDLGSIQRGGLATLFPHKRFRLKGLCRGAGHGHQIAGLFAPRTFGQNKRGGSPPP